MSIEIIPLTEDLIPQCGELLAGRQERDRRILPQLPARFEDPQVAAAAVVAALARKHARGVAAVQDGRLLGYLIGDMLLDSLWGRSAWVRTAGFAAAPDVHVEIVRDLYAALGAYWVSYGCFFHFALVPISDPALLQAWFSLSFGIEQVHALLSLAGSGGETPQPPPGVEIRRAGPQDRDHLAELSDLIWREQIQSPTWGIHLPESENRAGWADLAEDEEVTTWLAFEGGRVLGSQVYYGVETSEDDLMVPENCVRMTAAATRPEARGRGIGTSLTRHGLAQARADGFDTCETDWRSASLATDRFWRRRGFPPVVYRLVRRIDSRIAWANWEPAE